MKKELIDILKNTYKTGSRIKVLHIKRKTNEEGELQGIVKEIDDSGNIDIILDNGDLLKVDYKEDSIKLIRNKEYYINEYNQNRYNICNNLNNKVNLTVGEHLSNYKENALNMWFKHLQNKGQWNINAIDNKATEILISLKEEIEKKKYYIYTKNRYHYYGIGNNEKEILGNFFINNPTLCYDDIQIFKEI